MSLPMLDNLHFGTVAVIGDLMLDRYVSGMVNRISPEAPVPVLLHSQLSCVAGGAANVAANASALGARVRLIGLVGEDAAATSLLGALAQWPDIDTGGVITDPGWTTITKTRVLSGRQQIVRIDEERVVPLSAATTRRLIDAAVAAIATCDVLVCSDYAKGVLSDEVLSAVIAAGRARGVPVIVDPKRPTFDAYRGATLVTPNLIEMTRATGLAVDTDAEIRRAAQVASAQFGGDVLLTRSEEGMTLWRRDGTMTHAVTRKAEVFDVSGAGDTVLATVASVLSAGQSMETAIVIATAAAAISVSKLGTATVSRAELSRQLSEEMHDAGALVSLEQAAGIVENWKHHGATVVFTNGCFDLVHPGHVALIRAAAREGNKLIVALNTDRSVRRLKGDSRPIQDEIARATVIGALRDVDLVILFDEDTPMEAIRRLRPDVIVKGSDYTEDQVVGGAFVKGYGGRVALVDIVAGRSTSSLVTRAAGHGDRTPGDAGGA